MVILQEKGSKCHAQEQAMGKLFRILEGALSSQSIQAAFCLRKILAPFVGGRMGHTVNLVLWSLLRALA